MNISHNQFALIVAFLLPGFIGLAGIGPLVPLLATWLTPTSYAQASLGAPIYVLLAATTMGMLARVRGRFGSGLVSTEREAGLHFGIGSSL